jgi:probable rRNA maturation factor
MAVKFFFLDTKVSLSNRNHLKQFLNSLFKNEGTCLDSLTYIFCTDEYLLQINKQYLQHDYYTDIITFNLSTKKDCISGEIYISIDRVKENAIFLGEPLSKELHRVIFHGALHLCGYNDKSKTDKISMTAKENKYLDLYGI